MKRFPTCRRTKSWTFSVYSWSFETYGHGRFSVTDHIKYQYRDRIAMFKYKCQLNGPQLTFEEKYASLKKEANSVWISHNNEVTDWQNHSSSHSERYGEMTQILVTKKNFENAIVYFRILCLQRKKHRIKLETEWLMPLLCFSVNHIFKS